MTDLIGGHFDPQKSKKRPKNDSLIFVTFWRFFERLRIKMISNMVGHIMKNYQLEIIHQMAYSTQNSKILTFAIIILYYLNSRWKQIRGLFQSPEAPYNVCKVWSRSANQVLRFCPNTVLTFSAILEHF